MDKVLTFSKKFLKHVKEKLVSMINLSEPQPPVEIAFMTCIIRVDVGSSGWQKAVLAVLKSSKGVRSFRMDDNGVVEVSGTVNPNILLKMLAKSGETAEMCWFQFGQCSSNLFLPNYINGYGIGPNHSYYNRDDTFLQYRGSGARPQFRPVYKTSMLDQQSAFVTGPTNHGVGYMS